MKYTRADFIADLHNPEMLHIKDYKRFVAFHEELGKGEEQQNQQLVWKRLRHVEPKGKILELGCHVGYNLIHFAERGYDVTGVDISSTLLAAAEKRLSLLKDEIADRVTLIHSDILNLNGMGKFDTILLTEVLEHVIDPREILKKSREFMKPSSNLYVFAPSERVGNYSHVRGIRANWLKHTGQDLGITFKFIQANGYNTKAVGRLT